MMKNKGFTIIELLTVMAIIALLIGILGPVLTQLNRIKVPTAEAEIMIEAKILSIDGQMFNDRKTIEQFLEGKQIASDFVKVGVEFKINETIFLEDLKLSHAQISHLKKEKELPLKINIKVRNGTWSNIEIYLKDCLIKKIWLKNELATKLVKYIGTK